jgi:uncharacterized membrane protein YgcG
MKFASFTAVIIGLAILGAGATARANGRYPVAGLVVPDPTDAARVVVRTTYGIVSTHDRGATWGWICERAVGYGLGNEDPMVGITKGSAMLVGVFDGLAVSRDRGCQWDFVAGALTERYAADLSVERGDPSHAIVLVSNATMGDLFSTKVFESIDDARTWTQAGVDLPAQFLGLTLDAAPSDPRRIYVSGRYGAPGYEGVIERSDDRGKTWTKLPIPGSNDMNLPYIAGIDPKNAAVVYVRLYGDGVDTLLVSKDAGASFTKAFTGASLLGFALSPDGATVAVGGDKDGLWTADASALAFTQVSTLDVRCLAWNDQGLFACADEGRSGFSVGLSTNGGKTFVPFMKRDNICDVLACGDKTSTAKTCPALWQVTRITIPSNACGKAQGTSASTGASSGGGKGGGDSGGGGSGGGRGGGCSCGAAGGTSAFTAGGLLALCAAVLLGTRIKSR